MAIENKLTSKKTLDEAIVCNSHAIEVYTMSNENEVKKIEVQKETKKHWAFNEIVHRFDNGDVTRTFHSDVADNIYTKDGVIAIFNGEKITCKNRLALCIEVCARVLVKEKKYSQEKALLLAKKSAKANNSVPKLSDFGLENVSRHSVGFLNDLHVTSVKGLPVCNKK
jgi:hypothetical protein